MLTPAGNAWRVLRIYNPERDARAIGQLEMFSADALTPPAAMQPALQHPVSPADLAPISTPGHPQVTNG